MGVVFDRYISKTAKNDNIFARLSIDADARLSYVQPTKIEILESFGIGSPIVVIEFVDGVGDFFNHIKFDTGSTFTLDVGTSENAVSMSLRAIKIRHANTIGGKAQSIAMAVEFAHTGWNSMLHQRHNRSWANSKYTDVVSAIANEGGFSKVDVTPSRKTITSIIQPYWSNLNMIKWCQQRAVRDRGEESHYEFGVTTTGDFLFKSLADFYDSPPSIEYRLEGQPDRDGKRTGLRSDNDENSSYFIQFEQRENYMKNVLDGAGGFNSMYYDFNARQFIQSPIKFSGINQPQLCDWSMLKTSDESGTIRREGGREKDIQDISKFEVSMAINSIHDMSIRTTGTPFVHIGDLVELIIPVPPDWSNRMYNEIYGGYYMVRENIQTVLLYDSGNTNYTNKIILSRCGIDGKDGQEITQLVKSSYGKI